MGRCGDWCDRKAHVFARWVKHHALTLTVLNLLVAVVMLFASAVLHVYATMTGLVESVAFISHISIIALEVSAITGILAGLIGFIALVPTDDVLDDE